MNKKNIKASIESLQDMSIKDRAELDVWGGSELKQVNSALKTISRITLSVEVTNKDMIQEGGVAFATLKITRMNLDKGQEAKFIHSNNYPFLRQEKFLVALVD